MSTYLVSYVASGDTLIEANSKDEAVFKVRDALRMQKLSIDHNNALIHAKSVDEIRQLP